MEEKISSLGYANPFCYQKKIVKWVSPYIHETMAEWFWPYICLYDLC